MQAYKKIQALGTEVEFYLQSDLKIDLEPDFLELSLLIDKFDQLFNRFSASSELSRLNKATNNFQANPELTKILLVAKDFYNLTGGIFDPTILRTLEEQGYDRSFDSLDLGGSNELIERRPKTIDFKQIIINAENNFITKPPELKIDLGGIGKGYIVDKLVKHLKDKGYKNFWISAGGDMYLSGLTADGQTYQIGVQNPLKIASDLFNIAMTAQELAVATSGIAKRQWSDKHGHRFNHLIDPRTRSSVNNGLLAATVISDQVVKADIYAKTILILGEKEGISFIDQQENSEALIIDRNLKVSLSKNMNKYLTKI
ncbi:MAG: FAD:protein FMN transferase [Patescibacteria group bacterium]